MADMVIIDKKRTNMSVSMKRTLVVLLSLIVVTVVAINGWFIYVVNTDLAETRAANTELQQEIQNTKSSNETKITDLEQQVAKLSSEKAMQEELLKSREGFLNELAVAAPVIASAAGKIDISSDVQVIKEAQDKVSNERNDVSVVIAQVTAIQGAVKSIADKVAAYDAEQVRLEQERQAAEQKNNNNSGSSGSTSNKSSGSNSSGSKKSSNSGNTSTPKETSNNNAPKCAVVDGIGEARRALDAVGGGWVCLGVADVVCSVDWAAACSHPGGYIEMARFNAYESYDYWYPLMMHEYAHQIQYQNYTVMLNSSGYNNLFGGNIEWLADCMAMSRISGYSSGYGYGCSQDQLNYASNAWNGRF